jgi:flagellar basal-body rod protein FlgC
MVDPLQLAGKIAGSGLQAQSMRLRVVSENLANFDSTGKTPGANPYTRKTISFTDELDEQVGAELVKVDRIGLDKKPYRVEYDPDHPAADEKGYVKHPNVNMLVELSDMREANRSYEANMQVVKQARELISMTIDLLRSTS